MRIAVCDDENICLTELVNLIQRKYKSLDLIIDTFSSGEALIAHYRKNRSPFDIVLLDIEMKGMDGLKTASSLSKYTPTPIIIFVTSHNELACSGYEVSAFRFLTKPVNEHKLVEAIEAAQNRIREAKTILVHNSKGEYVIPVDFIMYIEAQNQQVSIVTEKEQFMQRGSIGTYEKELMNDGFYPVHRSYLVNLRFVKGFNKQEIRLACDKRLPLSRLRYKDFSQNFHDFIRRTAF